LESSRTSAHRALSVGVITASVSRLAGGLFHSVRRSAIAGSQPATRISVYGLNDAHTHEDLAAWQPLVPRTFEARLARPLGYAPEVGATLLAADHDLVHQHGLWQYLSVQASAWRRRTGRPVVISPRGMLDPWALRNSGWKKRIARLAFEDRNLKGAACLHALNAAEAAAIRALGLANPIAVIPNGVDLPDVHRRPARPGFYARDRHTLLFLGRMHPKKGLKELIEAWARLKGEAPKLAQDWQLVVAGWDDGGHRAGLEQLVARLGLAADVAFPGPLHGEAKAGALAHADAFILPSYSEGLPVAVLDAWAYAVPVFMTAACNLPEGFHRNAAVAIETEPAAMQRVLASHLGEAALSRRGVLGRQLVAESFTWERIARMQDDVYRWLAAGAERPAHVEIV
jgi:poly(glycerol-phosphate) alpha-glucosyltransferase